MAGDAERAAIEQLLDELRIGREAMAAMAAEGVAIARRHGEVPPDTVTVYGCGAILHGFYTALERCLQAIVRELDGEPGPSPEWHRRLLVAAASDRPGRRPPALSSATIADLDRYLRFRHLFRNLYVFHLDWEEIRPLLLRLAAVRENIEADLARFEEFLRHVLARSAD